MSGAAWRGALLGILAALDLLASLAPVAAQPAGTARVRAVWVEIRCDPAEDAEAYAADLQSHDAVDHDDTRPPDNAEHLVAAYRLPPGRYTIDVRGDGVTREVTVELGGERQKPYVIAVAGMPRKRGWAEALPLYLVLAVVCAAFVLADASRAGLSPGKGIWWALLCLIVAPAIILYWWRGPKEKMVSYLGPTLWENLCECWRGWRSLRRRRDSAAKRGADAA